MQHKPLALVVLLALLAGVAPVGWAQQPGAHPDLRLFFLAVAPEDDPAEEALDQIAAAWRDGYAGMFWDLLRFLRPPLRAPAGAPSFGDPADPARRAPVAAPANGAGAPSLGDLTESARRAPQVELPREHPSTRVWRRLMRFLEEQSGERFRDDISRVEEWIWDQPYDPHPDYALFKGLLYNEIDPRFREFFPPGAPTTIRLDEIDWGGVQPNGIPPLEYPTHLAVADDAAGYLDDDHIVFGVAMNGETRAYPKRILAWHEMVLDTIGGVELTIVYCTLCGTVIPYESVVDGQHITFGTSGLLYRSNKLMFDHGTKSLWNTFEGVPVVGASVGSRIKLRHRSVVTTTWGEWRRTHPETTVLSLETGHQRDYSEGAAYREYFATDRLIYGVSQVDDRLANKEEVVVMLLEDTARARHPVAIAARFLDHNRVYHTEQVGRQLVVVTSEEGANRVYEAGELRFTRELDEGRLADATGGAWRVTEEALVSETDPSRRLPRVAAQRAFWFGWYAQFPETVLIK